MARHTHVPRFPARCRPACRSSRSGTSSTLRSWRVSWARARRCTTTTRPQESCRSGACSAPLYAARSQGCPAEPQRGCRLPASSLRPQRPLVPPKSHLTLAHPTSGDATCVRPYAAHEMPAALLAAMAQQVASSFPVPSPPPSPPTWPWHVRRPCACLYRYIKLMPQMSREAFRSMVATLRHTPVFNWKRLQRTQQLQEVQEERWEGEGGEGMGNPGTIRFCAWTWRRACSCNRAHERQGVM